MNAMRVGVPVFLSVLTACGPGAEDPPDEEPSPTADRPPAQLVLVDRAGNVIQPVGDPHEMVTGPAFSPDGSALAVRERVDGNDDIYIHNLVAGTETRFTTDGAADMHPKWSPGGDRIAFFTYRNGLADVYVGLVGGADQETPLVDGPLHEYYPDWSPDGTRLTFHHHDPATNERDVWTVSLDGGTRHPVVAGDGREGLARISPDGRAMAYQSDENGEWEVFVVSFPEGDNKVQVSTRGGLWPKWAGTELFFFSGDTLMASVIDTKTGRVGPLSALFSTQDVGMPSPRTSQFNALYDVSPDGQRFAVVQR